MVSLAYPPAVLRLQVDQRVEEQRGGKRDGGRGHRGTGESGQATEAGSRERTGEGAEGEREHSPRSPGVVIVLNERVRGW